MGRKRYRKNLRRYALLWTFAAACFTGMCVFMYMFREIPLAQAYFVIDAAAALGFFALATQKWTAYIRSR